HGLAINRFTVSQLHTLEEAQNNYIKEIYGARGKTSTKVMLHMSKLPLISVRMFNVALTSRFQTYHRMELTILK
ncbi:hypothetical protein BCV71DRAFT_169858, partial [Rhizopus microsporus]